MLATALGNNFTASGTTETITLAAGVPAGDLVIVAIYASTVPSVNSVTDTQGNTYQQASGASGGYNATDNYFYYSVLSTPLSTSDHISLLPSNATTMSIGGTATGFNTPNGWAGGTSGVLDQGVKQGSVQTGNATMTDAATAALAQADELAWALFESTPGSAPTFTPGSGYTTDPNYTGTNGYAPGFGGYAYAEYQETSSTAALTATAGQTVANTYVAGTLTFKIARSLANVTVQMPANYR